MINNEKFECKIISVDTKLHDGNKTISLEFDFTVKVHDLKVIKFEIVKTLISNNYFIIKLEVSEGTVFKKEASICNAQKIKNQIEKQTKNINESNNI